MLSPIAFAAGALAWNAAEYSIHRFIGHGPRRFRPKNLLAQLTPAGLAGAFNEEHLAHHADPMYFAPSEQKAAAALSTVAIVGSIGSLVAGPRLGISFALGLTTSYLTYEVAHRRIHTHGPKTEYGRWMRKHHLLHHHRNPRENHGVMGNLWDKVFGTEIPAERVKVPRRVAPAWMLDPTTGNLAAEFEQDYELVGPARKADSLRDKSAPIDTESDDLVVKQENTATASVN